MQDYKNIEIQSSDMSNWYEKENFILNSTTEKFLVCSLSFNMFFFWVSTLLIKMFFNEVENLCMKMSLIKINNHKMNA